MLAQLRKLNEKARGIFTNEEGQGLVEYALILVLIAIVVIAAIKNVGTSTNNTFTTINSGLNAK